MKGKLKMLQNSMNKKIEENKNKILENAEKKTSNILKKALFYSIENLKNKDDKRKSREG